MYLFDASSIVNLVKRGVLTPLAEGVTLNLTLYECLNAIWKEHTLLRRLDKEKALEFADIIADIFAVVESISIEKFEREVLELAINEKLTIYDASYLYIAIRKKLILVTDDISLQKKASKYVKTLSTEDLISTPPRI